ncbi:MAG: mitofilin family membrane protein, partial [Hoeflea sp.]|nr:mitofilin family membrane protein [Hoeflea sp.]
ELQGQSSAQFSELSERIATLDQGQAELADQLDEPGRQIDLARAIAAAGLKSAIDRGGSFMSELEAFATVAPDDPAVPELRDLAASGVPSRSSLIEGFPEAATTAIAAADPVDPDAGLVDRLMSSALSVVKVRRVGEVEGDTAEAIAARAEARLMDGDLDAALAEWNQLPEASRAAASVYGEALAARARAEKLIAASMAPAGTPASSEAPAN